MIASPFIFAFSAPPSPTPTLPGDVINYIVQIDHEVEALNADMLSAIASGKVAMSEDFKSQRNAFYGEWKWFSGNYLSTGWVTTLPSSAWDQAAQYESKNEAWRDKFKALGGSSVGPGPQDRPQGADVTGAVKWGAAAVIAGAVAYGVYEFVGKRRSN